MKKVILATLNSGKVREFQPYFKALSIQIINQAELQIPSVEETGLTFVENALIKARYASKRSGLPAVADDSGLCVDALMGAPGIYSARYAGAEASDKDNINKLLEALDGVPKKLRTASFHCALVYLRAEHDPTPIICHGIWQGQIALTASGEEGFGYDPIFYLELHHCTAAELSSAQKQQLSHRGQALSQLIDTLNHANLT